MRRALIIVVVLAAAAFALGMLTAAFGAESDDDARLWAQMLERTRARAAANPFSGTVEVEWRDAAGTHREDIEISRADDVVQVSAGTHVVSSSDSSVVGPGVAMTISAAPLPALAAGKYDIKQQMGTAVAGRSTTRLDAILRSQHVVVARVYVDDETGLVLRRETFDEHGNLLRRVSFTRVEAEPPARKVTVPAARNAPVAKHELDPPYRDPSGVGVGFRRVGRWAHPDGLVQIYYSDGLLGVSVFEQPGQLSWSALPPAQGVTSVDGHPARRYALPVGETWVFERAGVVYTVVGDVPPRELAAVAADVSEPHELLMTRAARVVLSPFRW